MSDNRRWGEPSCSKGDQRYDEILTALANIRRRHVLYYLQDEQQASLTAVAEQLAAWEHEIPSEDVDEELIAKFKIPLYHNHLPHLQDASVVEYDARSKQLLLREPPDLVELCLDHCADCDLPE